MAPFPKKEQTNFFFPAKIYKSNQNLNRNVSLKPPMIVENEIQTDIILYQFMHHRSDIL